MTHRYGGPWSELKVAAVEYYLKCFADALTKAGMEIWYIDAFAGTGTREEEREVGGLLDDFKPIEMIIDTFDGSARKALAVEPPFKHFIFIEKDSGRAAVLRALKDEFPTRDVQIREGDANAELLAISRTAPWTLQGNSRHRGVAFLDPYALQLEWDTLKALAKTKSLDVWYLFPLRDVTRQLAHKISGVGAKVSKLDRVLGSEWRELYSLREPEQPNIFAGLEMQQPEAMRNASWRQIEQWFKRRLEDEFAYVSEPLPILTTKGMQTFSLFLAVGNPKDAATKLAKHFASYVRKNFAQAASRHRSGR